MQFERLHYLLSKLNTIPKANYSRVELIFTIKLNWEVKILMKLLIFQNKFVHLHCVNLNGLK